MTLGSPPRSKIRSVRLSYLRYPPSERSRDLISKAGGFDEKAFRYQPDASNLSNTRSAPPSSSRLVGADFKKQLVIIAAKCSPERIFSLRSRSTPTSSTSRSTAALRFDIGVTTPRVPGSPVANVSCLDPGSSSALNQMTSSSKATSLSTLQEGSRMPIVPGGYDMRHGQPAAGPRSEACV